MSGTAKMSGLMLTLRKIVSGEEMKTSNFVIASDKTILEVEEFFVDESYVILSLKMMIPEDQEEGQDLIIARQCLQVRSTENLQLIRSIWNDEGYDIDGGQYSNGRFIRLITSLHPSYFQ